MARNYLQAQRLYTLAAKQGNELANRNLDRLNDIIRTECPLIGQRVAITGTSRRQLNNKAGVATSFDHARGRYVVTPDDG